MAYMLPKVFYHINTSCFIAEKNEEIVGFLIWIMSQTKLDQAYIHFRGVHPGYRKNDIGKQLHEKYCDSAWKEDPLFY